MRQKYYSNNHDIVITADISLHGDIILHNLGFKSEIDIQVEQTRQLKLGRAKELQEKKKEGVVSVATRADIIRDGFKEKLEIDQIIRNVQVFFPTCKDNEIKYQILSLKKTYVNSS